MHSFIHHNPTAIYFGEPIASVLPDAIRPYGPRILLAYGRDSLKTSGRYDVIQRVLREAGKEVIDLGGIMPNPRMSKVREGIRLCKTHDIGFILAAGGGSVIDCAKAIAAGAVTDRDVWEAFYEGEEEAEAALPIGVVLTAPATGSEMNGGSVISHWEKKRKLAYHSPLLFPVFSVLDPAVVRDLPRTQLVYGVCDTISHIFETYFSPYDDDALSDDLAEATLKNIMRNIRRLLADASDATAASNLMWAATVGLNGWLKPGKIGDWQSHNIEHALSAHFDVPHGAGLAVVHPNYLRYFKKAMEHKLARFAVRVLELAPGNMSDSELAEAALAGIDDRFRFLGAPRTLTELGIPATAIPRLVEDIQPLRAGYVTEITRDDIRKVLESCV